MDDFYFDGGKEFNPYVYNRDQRAFLRVDVIQSAACILANAEVCAIAAAERAINADLRPEMTMTAKRVAVDHAVALFQLAQHIREMALRPITPEMEAAVERERLHNDKRERKAAEMDAFKNKIKREKDIEDEINRLGGA